MVADRPSYRRWGVRRRRSRKTIYSASISQCTGEDWTDVDLKLSTASPNLDTEIPNTTPYRISEPSTTQRALDGPQPCILSDSLRPSWDNLRSRRCGQDSDGRIIFSWGFDFAGLQSYIATLLCAYLHSQRELNHSFQHHRGLCRLRSRRRPRAP